MNKKLSNNWKPYYERKHEEYKNEIKGWMLYTFLLLILVFTII